MSMKHTPGPWVLGDELEMMGGCLARAIVGPGTFVGYALFYDEDDAVADANAHLIAAAPDMAEALAGMLSLLGNVDHSRGSGENAARLYGQMLNDFRGMATKALSKIGNHHA